MIVMPADAMLSDPPITGIEVRGIATSLALSNSCLYLLKIT